jgi:adenylate cyclase
VASRLEGINKIYNTEIIVSQSTWEQCSNVFEFRKLDRIAVVGRTEGLYLYQLYAQKNDIDKNLKKIFTVYEMGLQYYFERRWMKAIKCFSMVQKYRPSDIPSQIMLERCYQFMKNPPPEDWNGVFSVSSK